MALKLLIVEDEPEALRLYAIAISQHLPALKIQTATSPEEAIAACKKDRHDIIVTDYRLPHKHDGLRIAREICADHPEAVVFVVTADDYVVKEIVKDNVAGSECIRAVLAKPVNLRDLMYHITEAVAGVMSKGAV